MSNEKLGAEQGAKLPEPYNTLSNRLAAFMYENQRAREKGEYLNYGTDAVISKWLTEQADHARGAGALIAPIRALIEYHEKYAKSHVSSQWIYGENMMVVQAYKKVLQMIETLREPGADTGTTPPPTTYKSIPYEPNGRCVNCAAADQLQCVLDEAHEGDCMFAEWPYRAAAERGTTPPEGLSDEQINGIVSEVGIRAVLEPSERDYGAAANFCVDEDIFREILARRLAATQETK